jgi:hypothetical protein
LEWGSEPGAFGRKPVGTPNEFFLGRQGARNIVCPSIFVITPAKNGYAKGQIMATDVPSYSPLTSDHSRRGSTPGVRQARALLALSPSPRPIHQPRLRRGRTPSRGRTLELLASCPQGCTASLLQARGFTIEQIVALVRSGLRTRRPSAWWSASVRSSWHALRSRTKAELLCVFCRPRALQAVSDFVRSI